MTTRKHNASELAHGLTREARAPAWPRITDAEIRTLLTHYPQLGGNCEITWHAPRPFAATVRVSGAWGTVFVKRHHPRLRTPADLAVEHRFAAHLRTGLAREGRAIGVPVALAACDGTTACTVGGWTWEVLPGVAGVDVHRDTLSWEPASSPAEARAAGWALGALHCAATGFDAPARTAPWLIGRLAPLDASDPLAALHANIDINPALRAALAPWPRCHEMCADALAKPLSRLASFVSPPPLWSHGDWHVSNLLWSETGERPDAQPEVAAVLDFGLADRSCALFDLATAIERNAVAWLDLGGPEPIARPDLARAIVDGYHAIRPMDGEARRHLAAMLPVVHLGFALSEIGYFDALLHDREAVALAFETFLLGHARWFDTQDGAGLLTALVA